MIDSTNPRILANNIRKLFDMVRAIVPGTVVEGNPSGSGYNTLLTKIKIGTHKYKLPLNVEANPEGEATGNLSSLGIDGAKYNIPVYSPADFSTEEVDTGIKWVNDSPIYRKTISIGEVSAATSKNVDHNITNLGDVIRIYGTAYKDNRFIALPFVDNVDTYQRYIEISTSQVIVGTGTNSAALTKAYITIEYTKVTTP